MSRTLLLVLAFFALILSTSAHANHRRSPRRGAKRDVQASTCTYMSCAAQNGACGLVGSSLTFCPVGQYCGSNSMCANSLALNATCDPSAPENQCAQGSCVESGSAGAVCQIFQEIMYVYLLYSLKLKQMLILYPGLETHAQPTLSASSHRPLMALVPLLPHATTDCVPVMPSVRVASPLTSASLALSAPPACALPSVPVETLAQTTPNVLLASHASKANAALASPNLPANSAPPPSTASLACTANLEPALQ